jgi:hypothetical protein
MRERGRGGLSLFARYKKCNREWTLSAEKPLFSYPRYRRSAKYGKKMKKSIFAVLLLASALCMTSFVEAATVTVQEYNWDHPYWHHHHYGYWRHHRGYWAYRHGEHVFINVD